MTRLRKKSSFQHGALNIQAVDEDIILYTRQKTDSDLYAVVLNLGASNKTLNINNYYNLGQRAEVITISLQSQYKDGQNVNPASFVANPNVGTVLVAA